MSTKPHGQVLLLKLNVKDVTKPCVDTHAAVHLLPEGRICPLPSVQWVQKPASQHVICKLQVNMYIRYVSFSGAF